MIQNVNVMLDVEFLFAAIRKLTKPLRCCLFGFYFSRFVFALSMQRCWSECAKQCIGSIHGDIDNLGACSCDRLLCNQCLKDGRHNNWFICEFNPEHVFCQYDCHPYNADYEMDSDNKNKNKKYKGRRDPDCPACHVGYCDDESDDDNDDDKDDDEGYDDDSESTNAGKSDDSNDDAASDDGSEGDSET